MGFWDGNFGSWTLAVLVAKLGDHGQFRCKVFQVITLLLHVALWNKPGRSSALRSGVVQDMWNHLHPYSFAQLCRSWYLLAMLSLLHWKVAVLNLRDWTQSHWRRRVHHKRGDPSHKPEHDLACHSCWIDRLQCQEDMQMRARHDKAKTAPTNLSISKICL